ncbi:MAG TPA: isoprenylcysteine carboxylmethyltransferase family protein [Gemmatimonadaceae bacterium]|nr:isoprenylcysteine carboxylmethyltransferase family protein [Gemmatimonadaceae bacterium]
MNQDSAAQDKGDLGTARAVARPPRLFLAALLLGLALDRLLPLRLGAHEGGAAHWIAGGFLVVIGLALATAGIRNFGRAATPVPTIEPTRTLVTTGVHAFSRNPIYLGMFVIYAGIGVAVRSSWMLLLALPLAIVMRYGVVAREEAYLERRFGDAYRAYKARVRRWL